MTMPNEDGILEDLKLDHPIVIDVKEDNMIENDCMIDEPIEMIQEITIHQLMIIP